MVDQAAAVEGEADDGCVVRQEVLWRWLMARPVVAAEANALLIAQAASVTRGHRPQLNADTLDTVLQVIILSHAWLSCHGRHPTHRRRSRLEQGQWRPRAWFGVRGEHGGCSTA
jgi:hypothetical protein